MKPSSPSTLPSLPSTSIETASRCHTLLFDENQSSGQKARQPVCSLVGCGVSWLPNSNSRQYPLHVARSTTERCSLSTLPSLLVVLPSKTPKLLRVKSTPRSTLNFTGGSQYATFSRVLPRYGCPLTSLHEELGGLGVDNGQCDDLGGVMWCLSDQLLVFTHPIIHLLSSPFESTRHDIVFPSSWCVDDCIMKQTHCNGRARVMSIFVWERTLHFFVRLEPNKTLD